MAEDKELFYRNVMLDDDEEAAVKASKGYGLIVEIILEGGVMETAIRMSPAGALALGNALLAAGSVAARS